MPSLIRWILLNQRPPPKTLRTRYSVPVHWFESTKRPQRGHFAPAGNGSRTVLRQHGSTPRFQHQIYVVLTTDGCVRPERDAGSD